MAEAASGCRERRSSACRPGSPRCRRSASGRVRRRGRPSRRWRRCRRPIAAAAAFPAAATLHLVAEEVQDMTGDRREVSSAGLNAVLRSGLRGSDDGDDLFRRAMEVRQSDAIARAEDRYRLSVRRQGRAVVDVVHALELHGLPGVHFEDHPVGQVDPGLVVADRRRWDQIAVGGDPGDLDQRDVEMAEEASHTICATCDRCRSR